MKTIKFEDLTLAEDAYVCQTGGEIHYLAKAKNSNGSVFTVRWDNPDLSQEDESNCCDWDKPERIFDEFGNEHELVFSNSSDIMVDDVFEHAKKLGLNYDHEDIRIVSGEEFDKQVKYWAISNFFTTDSGIDWVEAREDENAKILILDPEDKPDEPEEKNVETTFLGYDDIEYDARMTITKHAEGFVCETYEYLKDEEWHDTHARSDVSQNEMSEIWEENS